MNNFIRIFCFAVLAVVFASCNGDDTHQPSNTDQHLLGATSILKRTASDIQNYLQAYDLEIPIDDIIYNVEVFKVTYRTTYKGEEIIASGLVILPETSDRVSMLSFQHGTISSHSDAPSKQPLGSPELVYYSALSTLGLITVIPDYIGFGSSEHIMHPYYVEEYSAGAVIDLLKAAKELSIKKKKHFNEQLFLAGYSQGGYVTMATHKYIEQEELSGFTLTASFPAAGGYDVKRLQEYFFEQETYNDPYYLAYVARSYQVTYNWSQLLSEFFQEPYASRIPALFDGTKGGSEINAQLTNDVSGLIASDIRENINTASEYNYIVNALQENSLTDWTPSIKMFMYHGTSDITVPYENSVSVYDNFIERGSSSVQLISLQDATHSSGLVPYIEDFVPKLLTLKE